jgi:hypothetical protein
LVVHAGLPDELSDQSIVRQFDKVQVPVQNAVRLMGKLEVSDECTDVVQLHLTNPRIIWDLVSRAMGLLSRAYLARQSMSTLDWLHQFISSQSISECIQKRRMIKV